MRTAGLLLAMALWLGLAAAATAGPGDPVPANLGEYRSRIEGLDQAVAELREARVRVAELERQRARQRQQRYPRGEAKAELEAEWRQAVTEEARLERRWADLLEKARREGVPPGVLRRYREVGG